MEANKIDIKLLTGGISFQDFYLHDALVMEASCDNLQVVGKGDCQIVLV
jgi:hypothetical protein